MDNIRNLVIFSFIFGLIAGILALVPFLGIFILLIMMFCSSFIIIVLMKKTGYIVFNNEAGGLLYGGIAGFVSFIGFAITFLPVAYILSLIFKESYYTGISFIVKNGFSIMLMIVLFIGILCALMNAFSGLASVYVSNNPTGQTQKKFTLDIAKGLKNGFRFKNKND